jgi:hypothetical protein
MAESDPLSHRRAALGVEADNKANEEGAPT